MYDAIVVGARCAGSPTAMLLARKGYRVLLVDRATFPSDTMSTHALRAQGTKKLKDWGLLDRVANSGCPPIRQAHFDIGVAQMTVPMPPFEDIDATYCPRRTVLDKILVDAAVEAGAELREAFTFDDLTWKDGRATGIVGHARGGEKVTEEARIVIGADGLHSQVAKAAGAPIVKQADHATCGYYGYFSGVPCEGFEFYFREGCYILVFPTHDGQVCIAMERPQGEFKAFREDVEGNFMRTLELAPGLHARMANAKREEKLIGIGELPNQFRQTFGPGWALIGDASYHRDAILGSGITDAWYEADYLAEAVDAGLSGAQPMEAALARYEQRRDEFVAGTWAATLKLVQFPPPQEAIGIWTGGG
ncbi:MAG: NAD(P)/FAD-dependent oxidoreductase [Chloroflexi bacterium]|nr:NAD(P)/FAD-dependent oxidoreductase [Chloroflexota bacterium]